MGMFTCHAVRVGGRQRNGEPVSETTNESLAVTSDLVGSKNKYKNKDSE